ITSEFLLVVRGESSTRCTTAACAERLFAFFDVDPKIFNSTECACGAILFGMHEPVRFVKLTVRRMMPVLLLCLGMYLLACAYCAVYQRRFIYFPQLFTSGRVDELGRSAALERWRSPSGKDLGWKRLSPEQPSQGQILIFHGNGGCAFQCAHYADVIQK